VLLTTTLSGSAASADEWTDSYEEGKVALEHGEWDKAIESLQKALALRPEPGHQAMTSGLKMVEYLPHYQLGQAYFYSGDYRSAIESLDRAERAGAVAKTSHRQHFGRLREIIQQLVASSERMTQERSLSSRITTALGLSSSSGSDLRNSRRIHSLPKAAYTLRVLLKPTVGETRDSGNHEPNSTRGSTITCSASTNLHSQRSVRCRGTNQTSVQLRRGRGRRKPK
jgi:hypothetical protein